MHTSASRGRHAAPLAGPPLWRTWTPGAARAVAIVLVAAIALVAWWWWQGRPRPVDVIDAPMPAAAADSSEPSGSVASGEAIAMLTVHVIGGVRNPGIVQVPTGARVADVIEAAGGFRDRRAAARVNLARLVSDGEQIDVRREAAAGVEGSTESAPGPININRADASMLDALPGIGPVLAERIITWRDANGPFPNVDVLSEVSGIGPSLMEQLRPLITV